MKIVAIIILFQTILFGGRKNSFSLWDKILKENVAENGLVNYSGIKNDSRFEKCLEKFETTNIGSMSKYEKLSFLINAYNAFVIKNVLDHKKMLSPLDDKNFFKTKKFTLSGKKVSLDEIEHNYVLKIEPSLSHFGLVCGAVSCPKLIPLAYTSDNVINQLKINATQFINNKSQNFLDKENRILNLSQIFNWFRKYFGKSDASIKNYVTKFLNKEDKDFIELNETKINFIKYDWKLNSQL